MTKERRLGRGLAALLSEPPEETSGAPRIHEPVEPSGESASTDSGERPSDPAEQHIDLLLDVNEIVHNPFQPRRDFGEDEIASLAASLREHDMLQPVLVRKHEGRWQLISGERRLRAAVRAGWTHVPARVKDADDRLVAELAIVENLQRKDLNPIEKALSFQRYLHEHQCTQEELGKRLQIDRSTIANLVRLLELPEPVRAALQHGQITGGHARALLPLGEQNEQIEFCHRIQREGLSVRATERLVQELVNSDQTHALPLGAAQSSKPKRTRSTQIASMEQDLRRALGTKVDIQTGARGRGKFVIHFKNHGEFERLQRYLTDGSVSAAAAATG